jgi:hypothetical protein
MIRSKIIAGFIDGGLWIQLLIQSERMPIYSGITATCFIFSISRISPEGLGGPFLVE